jgi:putative phage-type endonuclease
MASVKERSEPTVVASPGTSDWFEARSTGIGASEAAAAVGLSRWSTGFELYHRKRGNTAPVEENDAMRMGKRLEPIVVDEFREHEEIPEEAVLYPVPMFRSGTHDFVLATPDALLLDADAMTSRNPSVVWHAFQLTMCLSAAELLECKTVGWRSAEGLGEDGSDFVPFDWLCQAQQQMFVMGLDSCHFAVLIDGRTYRQFRVARDEELIERIVEAEAELWRRVKEGDEPEPDWKHPKTAALIAHLHGLAGESITLTAAAGIAWDEYEELGRKIKEMTKPLNEQREELKARVLHEMGTAAVGLLPGGERQVTRSQQEEKEIAYTRKAFVNVRASKVRD